MRNPYEVLGIKETASKEEIRSAYRDLAKKYHPDQYGDNPLRDLAEEKMRELNEAYDALMKQKETYTSRNSYEGSSNLSYEEIRRDIQSGRYSAAEQKLNNISSRDAEWNFLMGMVHMNKGWNDSAYNYLSTAYSMNPNNLEYAQALNFLKNRNMNYRQQYYGSTRSGNDSMDCCMNLICMDCLCECCGGDLISCI
ncbi:J domain-containing protein [Clostridium polynesiense]|uniref:J domain-containing protein n=1 Tax=Clostridium polynesiense TaxID=1325933 RepID=UPI00058CC7FB|nr:J domain-containing protein [Clostridium polynesiense]